MGEVVVAVVGEAELQDLSADVLGQGASVVVGRRGGGGGGRLAAVSTDGGGGRGGLVVGETGDGVGVVVDADEDAVGGVGGPRARAEAERGEVAGLAVTASAHGVCDGGGKGRRRRGAAQTDAGRLAKKSESRALDGLGCHGCYVRFVLWASLNGPSSADTDKLFLWPRPSGPAFVLTGMEKIPGVCLPFQVVDFGLNLSIHTNFNLEFKSI